MLTEFAKNERAHLVALLRAVGPGHRTLCEGWQTADLLAHLLLRERRPVAAAGMFLRPFARHTKTAMTDIREMPWPEQLRLLAQGPPAWNPMGWSRLEGLANAAEFFVHHEDVRRANEGWTERLLDAEQTAVVRRVLPIIARLALRKLPFGVTAELPDRHIVLRQRRPMLTIVGRPGEIVLWTYGREQVHVSPQGEPAVVAAHRRYQRGV